MTKFQDELKKRLGVRAVRPASKQQPRGQVTHVIPSGLTVLDQHVYGGGGYPCRRMTEIAGDEGIGKSTLLYQGLAEAQKIGADTVLFETECRLDKARLASFGVDLDSLYLFDKISHLEELLATMEGVLAAAAKSTHPLMLGWDSLASCPTEAEVKNGLVGKDAVADRARILSKTIRVLAEKVATSNTALVIVNQLRTNIGQTFGDNQKSVGGNALQYYASLRVRLRGGKAVKRGSYRIGVSPLISTNKNLATDPHRKARCFLLYKGGWQDDRSLMEFGKDQGWISEGAKLSAAALDRIREIGDLSGWDLPEAVKVMDSLDAKEAKPAAVAKKTTKKKTTKKKVAKKTTKKATA